MKLTTMHQLCYRTTFKYLGHILNDNLCADDDIQREVKNLYVRRNILLRKFGKCSFNVKLKLFRTYCLCFYDINGKNLKV